MDKCKNISTENYSANIFNPHHEFVYMQRTDKYERSQKIIDTFGPVWIFIWSHLKNKNQLKVKTRDNIFSLEGKLGILIPPYSIVKWIVAPGELKWKAIVSTKSLPEQHSKFPAIYNWDEKEVPTSLNELFLELKNPLFQIYSESCNSKWAMLFKAYLEKNYLNKLNIKEFSCKYGISRTSLTRAFQNNYGLSPVEYRTRLRLFQACKVFIDGGNVTEAMLESGFSNPAQFFLFYKKVFGTTPSNHQLSKFKS